MVSLATTLETAPEKPAAKEILKVTKVTKVKVTRKPIKVTVAKVTKAPIGVTQATIEIAQAETAKCG